MYYWYHIKLQGEFVKENSANFLNELSKAYFIRAIR